MAAHQVGDQILLQTVTLVEPLILLPEPFVDLEMGLPHVVQHLGGAVLRRNLQLPGNVVSYQVGEKFAVFLAQHIVKPDTAADKYFLYARHRPNLPQKRQVIGVAGVQILAGSRSKTGTVFAHAVF